MIQSLQEARTVPRKSEDLITVVSPLSARMKMGAACAQSLGPSMNPTTGMSYALITGGTDGIGRAIAHRLAARSLGVVIVGSNPEKGRAAAGTLRKETANDNVHFVRADLSLMRNVEELAAQVSNDFPRVRYLVHCAGIVRGRRVLTIEGIESNFAVSYLSRSALTQRLISCLASTGESGAAARILVVGGAARGGVIHYDDINLAKRFSTLGAVAQFCEANDVFVVEQSRRLAAAGLASRVTITTLKVGAVRTNIRKQLPLWMKILVPLLIDPFLTVTPEAIAASAERLLLAPEFESTLGAAFIQIKRMKATSLGRQTQDLREGRRLWGLSEDLVAGAHCDCSALRVSIDALAAHQNQQSARADHPRDHVNLPRCAAKKKRCMLLRCRQTAPGRQYYR
jgi:NAD(P)-dependent dehydrogenase (short-subunit alcohol dehydrogenase family)